MALIDSATINKIRMSVQGSNPASPAATFVYVFTKADGVYAKLSDGTVQGPFAAASGGAAANGWNSDANTWTYSSADGPTGVISINADMTGILSAGDRIKLTQTTVKYFIVTVVGSFGGGATLVTVYGGTDYTLANASITSPSYSHMKVPVGFNADPLKWTETLADTTAPTQATPTSGTWYNLGSLSLSIPIGAWRVHYEVAVEADRAASGTSRAFVTLSTANNSESDAQFTSFMGADNLQDGMWPCHRMKHLNLSSKTSYYLNSKTNTTSISALNYRGDLSPTLVYAICAYL